LWKYQPRERRIFLSRPAGEVAEPAFLLDPGAGALGRVRVAESALGTLGVHLAILSLIVLATPEHAPRRDEPWAALRLREATPLVAPPPDLVRRLTGAPPVPRELSLEQLTAPPSARPGAAPAPFRPPPAPRLPEAGPVVAEPPVIQPAERAAIPAPPGSSVPALPAPPPPGTTGGVIAFESPAAFEAPRTPAAGGPGTRPASPGGGIPRPASTVTEAVQEVARAGGGGAQGLIIGDVESGPGGMLEARGIPPTQGDTGSNVQLLSDPKGVDFRPYLIRVLQAVRRNWFAVLPESARLGRRGKTVIQFAIDRSGRVPKLVIASPSGLEALDRAAVAGISASNPFPPLPAEFTGEEIRLQLNFLYNIKR
jgi:TonB family protein